MFIQRCFKSVILKLSNWYYVLFGSEATEQEVQDYIARLERAVDELAIELDYQEHLAKQEAERAEAEHEDQERERQKLEYELGCRNSEIEMYEQAEQERRDRQEEDEQQHYRSYCPHCG